MGRKRIIGIQPVNFYHVVSRVVDRRLVMGDREKTIFRGMLERQCAFANVRCVTYCVMGNHFHLLLEIRAEEAGRFVQEAADGSQDFELCRRVAALEGEAAGEALAKELGRLRTGEDGADPSELVASLTARMGDLASFVRELKWRFSRWYNLEHGRVGTLWEGRFRSVLVESGPALRATAAYIDLNPVRAGIVADPRDYRFCGYSEAVANRGKDAREGIFRVVAAAQGSAHGEGGRPSWTEVDAAYRALMGAEDRGGSADSTGGDGGSRSPQPPPSLNERVRYLTAGEALGSQEFLDALSRGRPEFFPPGRKVAGRKMRGGDWEGLFAVRDVGV